MTPIQMGLLILLLGVGFTLGWFARSFRRDPLIEDKIQKLIGEASGHVSSVASLRKQVDEIRMDSDRIRIRLEEALTAKASLEATLAAEKQNVNEQKRLLAEAEKQFREVFKSLASESLESTQKTFMALAGSEFESLSSSSKADLDLKEQSIRSMVDPLKAAVEKLATEVSSIESSRKEAYGELKIRVEQLTKTEGELRLETNALVQSLRQPQVKGKWGELSLRRAAELAGMIPYCDFVEQETVETEDGRFRPDMIVNLTDRRQIIVDAKVPQHAFLKAVQSKNEQDYKGAMGEHVRLVRNHINQLATRSYWSQFDRSPQFVVCYLPAESFFSAALEFEPGLLEEAKTKNILLASPTILIAVLCAVATGWKEGKVAENAERISALGKELYDRIVNFAGHMEELRSGIEKASSSFNRAIGSLETRVLPSARKFSELGITASEQIPLLEPSETAVRPLNIVEIQPDESPEQRKQAASNKS